jgi:hypothetical protein
MGRLIPAGTGMEFYRRIKIPDEVVERPEGGLGRGWRSSLSAQPRLVNEGRSRRKAWAAFVLHGAWW